MSKCRYCNNEFTNSASRDYCSRKCRDDDQRSERERKEAAREQNEVQEKINRNTSQAAKWCFYLSFVTFFALPFASAGKWWALILPFFVIVLGHKGLKQIRQSPHLSGKFIAFIGLVIGYLVFFASLGHLAGCVKV